MTFYPPPGQWTDHAACKGRTHMFALSTDPRYHDTRRTNRAITTCRTCPVLDECRQWALQEPEPVPWMVAGALTPGQRDQLRQRRVTA